MKIWIFLILSLLAPFFKARAAVHYYFSAATISYERVSNSTLEVLEINDGGECRYVEIQKRAIENYALSSTRSEISPDSLVRGSNYNYCSNHSKEKEILISTTNYILSQLQDFQLDDVSGAYIDISYDDYPVHLYRFIFRKVYTIIKVSGSDISAFEYYLEPGGTVISNPVYNFDISENIKLLNNLIQRIKHNETLNKFPNDEALGIAKIYYRVLIMYENNYIINNAFLNICYFYTMISRSLGYTPPDFYLNRTLFLLNPTYLFNTYNIDSNIQFYFYWDNNPIIYENLIYTVFAQLQSNIINKKEEESFIRAIKLMYFYGNEAKRKYIKKRTPSLIFDDNDLAYKDLMNFYQLVDAR